MKLVRRFAILSVFLLFVAVVGVVPTGGVGGAPVAKGQLTGTGSNYLCSGSFTLSIQGGISGVVCSTVDLANLDVRDRPGPYKATIVPGHTCFFLDASDVGDCANPGSGDPCAGTSNCFGAEFTVWEISFCDPNCEVDRIEFYVGRPSGTGRFSDVTGSLEFSAQPGDQEYQISGEIWKASGGPSAQNVCEARGGTFSGISPIPDGFNIFSCVWDGQVIPNPAKRLLERACWADPDATAFFDTSTPTTRGVQCADLS